MGVVSRHKGLGRGSPSFLGVESYSSRRTKKREIFNSLAEQLWIFHWWVRESLCGGGGFAFCFLRVD